MSAIPMEVFVAMYEKKCHSDTKRVEHVCAESAE
jgi:hypothetical protein